MDEYCQIKAHLKFTVEVLFWYCESECICVQKKMKCGWSLIFLDSEKNPPLLVDQT